MPELDDFDAYLKTTCRESKLTVAALIAACTVFLDVRLILLGRAPQEFFVPGIGSSVSGPIGFLLLVLVASILGWLSFATQTAALRFLQEYLGALILEYRRKATKMKNWEEDLKNRLRDQARRASGGCFTATYPKTVLVMDHAAFGLLASGAYMSGERGSYVLMWLCIVAGSSWLARVVNQYRMA